jgi:hypothetical protein
LLAQHLAKQAPEEADVIGTFPILIKYVERIGKDVTLGTGPRFNG